MRFIRTVFFMYMVTSCTNFLYAAPIPEITILTRALGNTGEKFPDDLIKFWETITISQNNSNIEIAPKVKLLRIDLAEEKELGIPLTDSLFESLINKSIKPDPRVTLKKAHDYLELSKINNYFSNNQPSDEKQIKARKEKYQAEVPSVFEIFQTKSSLGANHSKVNEILSALKKNIERDIVAGINPIKYLVFYNLSETAPNLPPENNISQLIPASKQSSKCDSQTDINQGIQYISMAKAKPTLALQKSDLTNAFNIFDNIAKSSPCCTKAIMYRGIVRDLLGESNLAIDDLEFAEQCDLKNTDVHYNLACYYSKHSTKNNNKLDLSFKELEKAVVEGFKNCNLILNDMDLENLRRDKEFKVKLRDMLQRNNQYCIVD